MSPLTVAIVQSELRWHDAAANRLTFENAIRDLDSEVDLIVLPEMFTTGFTMDARGQAESMQGSSVNWLRDTARQCGSALCGSLVIEDGGRYFNRFVMMQPDGTAACYDKRHLFRLAGEDEHYAAGRNLQIVDLQGWRVRPMVCYDLRFPIWSRRRRHEDFDILIYVANWPSPRHQAWETLLRARAIENQCYVIGVNRVGTDNNGLSYAGGSVVIDFFGNELVNLGREPGSATVALDGTALQEFRERFPFDADADSFEIRGIEPGS